jgi:hypothetical protein
VIETHHRITSIPAKVEDYGSLRSNVLVSVPLWILAFARMEGEYRWTVHFSDKRAFALIILRFPFSLKS